jgi:hypothetical protein
VSKLAPKDKLAFYTNAYNALVLEAVLENKLPESVLKVDGFFDKKTYTVAGEQLTLNALEEKKIRSSKDPRVHFVVNCASISCPPLRARVYDGATWDKSLEEQTKRYLTKKGEVQIDDAKKTITVVKLFEWYAGDWGGEAKIRAFLAKYLKKDAAKINDPAYKLAYREYDWNLNATK